MFQFTNRPKRDSANLLWLSDLHLDRADSESQSMLYDTLAGIDYDAAVITGDITSSPHLNRHLTLLARASGRPVAFVLGNHDYSGSSIEKTRKIVADVCSKVSNLHHLRRGTILPLTADTALIGTDGWADAREGILTCPATGHRMLGAIHDFRSTTPGNRLHTMRELGKESAAEIRATLPLALSCHRHVIVATHVPPFPSAARFDEMPCKRELMPFFSNMSLGLALIGIARRFPNKLVTVLAGHTHCRVEQQWILPNLEVRVAGAQPSNPTYETIIELGETMVA